MMGKTIESGLTLREALDARRRVLGEEHPKTRETMKRLPTLEHE